MQGREAKHVCLQQYARHSNISQRRNSVRSTTIFLLSGYENKTLSILLTIKIDLVLKELHNLSIVIVDTRRRQLQANAIVVPLYFTKQWKHLHHCEKLGGNFQFFVE